MNKEKKRKSGIDITGDIPWGAHLCQFYQTKEDLLDILVPYFKTGLENNEFCMWVVSDPLTVEAVTKSLKKAVKDLDDYIKKGQIEILDYSQWYIKSGKFEADKVLQSWVEKEQEAIKKGFVGLRLTGNTFWLEKNDWKKFVDYEAMVNNAIGKYKMIGICTYSLDKCGATEIIDVVNNHGIALIKRESKWECIESIERKKAEEALRESGERLSAFMESSPDTFTLFDSELNLVEVNKAGLEAFGKTKEEIIGRNILDVNPTLKENGRYDKFLEVLRTGKPLLIDDFVPHPMFGDLYLSMRVFKVGDGLGFIVTDITERKKAEEALGEEKERAQRYLNIAGAMILVIDADETITLINRQGCEILGYSEDEIIGKNWFDTFIAEPIREEIRGVFRKLMAGEVDPVEYYENPVITKSGEERFIAWHNTVLKDEAGNIIGTLSSAEDITERKRVEEEKRKTEERYRDVIENIFEFVPEGLLVFTDKLSLYRQNKAFQDIVKEYSAKLGYTEEEFREIIIEQLKDRIVNENHAEIRIPMKQR
ncbi:MEDS domain-containing protein [Patescibacteria group bacterium]